MARTIVALDLETTGLDPAEEAIIEIGAVKFDGDRVVDEFDQLVHPGRPISRFITQLTGITNEMVARQPAIDEVLPALESFVGTDPILGHNIRFDYSFLRPVGALPYNHRLDTFDLAAVLLPSAPRYGLGSLAATVGVPLPATHRALDDARVTHLLYLHLFQRALEMPLDILAEIVRLGQDVEWWGGDWPLQEALRARAKDKLAGPRYVSRSGLSGPLFADDQSDAPPLLRKEPPEPLDRSVLTALFEPDGALDRNLPAYEHRPQQVHMMQAVARALSENRHLLVEAGTGTGKSLAYLAPAIRWAWQNGQRVVVSTNTINLQDQLINKDLPAMRAALGIPFQAALLKGRANYVCPRRVESLRRHRPRTAEEMRVLAKLLVWLPNSAKGDRSEITLTGGRDRAVWQRLSAQDEGCTADRCVSMMGGICPFYRARRAAENAHVLVVNHALLLADVAAENRVLPEYQYLIVDEAHHFEAATTDGLSFEGRQIDLERRLKELGGPTAGLLGQALSNCRKAIPPGKFGRLEQAVSEAHSVLTTALEHSGYFFGVVLEFVRAVMTGRNANYATKLRLHPPVRSRAEWEDVEFAWGRLEAALSPVIEKVAAVARGLGELEAFDIDEREDMILALGAAARFCDDFANNMNALVSNPSAEHIYWIELSGDGKRLSLHAAPLAVGPLVEQHIWHAKDAVVMTSATLTTAGEFDYVRGRLNAQDADELAVGSPFDYEASTLLYIPTDIPEPSDRQGHQHALERGLIELCRATRGRTLVLFTAYAQLRQTAQAIRGPLERAGVVVYDQTSGSSRHQLLESFKADGGAVLLGTRSFWEGIDVPGDALSVLVIVKLPFDVPSDPIVAARSETFENAFMEYAVPEAVLRLRQGFGRLIRTAADRGVVVLFDRRVTSKRYGIRFLDSLPGCTRRFAPLDLLPQTAAEWLDGA